MGSINSSSIIKAVFVLFPARTLHAVGMDVLLTSIPQIQNSWDLTQPQIQVVVSAYMLATSLSHLFIGPLNDKFGRRSVTLISIAAFVLGSLGASISQNINELIYARALQGVGSCGASIGVVAVLRDIFDEKQRANVMSYLNGMGSLAPILAPSIGSFILMYFGTWRNNFLCLLVCGVMAFVLWFVYVPETKPMKELTFHQNNLLYEYWKILSNRTFLCYVIPGVTALVTLLIFFSVSSILILEILQESIYKFSLLFASNGLVCMAGSFVAPLLLNRFSLAKCIMIGSVIMILGSILLIGTIYTLPLSVWAIFIPNYLQTFGSGIIAGNSLSGAIEPFKHHAGLAAATYGFVLYGLASIIASIVMMFEINSMLIPAITMLVLGFLNILVISFKF